MTNRLIAAPRRALRIGAAVIAMTVGAGAAAPTPAPAGMHETALFDLHFGGIWAGTLDLALHFEDGAYRAAAAARTKGLVGALYGASFSAEARGDDGPNARPDAFTAKGSFGGDKIALAIMFGPTAPTSVTADPAFKPKPHQIDPAAQTGVFDPLGAAALLLRERPDGALCNARLDVFDGRRRTRVMLSPPKDRPRRGEIQCDATLTRVAGWKPKDMKKPPFSFRLFFARPAEGAPARLSRFEVDTGYGLATAVRRN